MNKLFPFVRLFFVEWRGLALGFLLSFICVVAGVALLSLSGWLICAAASAGLASASALTFNYFVPAAGIRFFALLRIVSRYGERVVNHKATFSLLRDLRVWCYSKIEPLAPAHFYRYRSGDLLQRFVGDINTLDTLYLRVLSPLLNVLLLAGLVLLFLHFFSVELAWVIVACVLISLVSTSLLSFYWGRATSRRMTVLMSELRLQLVTNFQNVKTMTLFGAVKRRLDHFAVINAAYIKAQAKMAHWQGLSIALVMLLSGVTVSAILFLSVPLLHDHQLSGAVVGMIVLMVLGVFEVMTPLPSAFQYLGQTQLAAERITELTSSKPTVIFPEISLQLPQQLDIDLRNVSFRYPGQTTNTLTNVNLQIPMGQHVAITGETGAGKTTLIRLLVRAWDISEGELLFGGVNVKRLPEKKLRQTIAIASQRTSIFNASLRDNLTIANKTATDEDIWNVLDRVELKPMAQTLMQGLDTIMGEFGCHFSGGQIKRIGIARAILSKAPIVILDEPSEGVDDQTYAQVWGKINRALEGRTLIVVTHHLAQLQGIDACYVARDGLLADIAS